MILKSPLDTCFQSLDSEETVQNICCLAILKKELDAGELESVVREAAKRYPKLKYILGPLSSRYFIRPLKDVTPCVPLSENSLKGFLGKFSEKLDSNQLPWKILYSGSKEGTQILSYMLSHALGDGVSGLDFFHSLSNKSENKALKKDRAANPPKYFGATKSIIKEMLGKPNIHSVNGINSSKRELLLLTMPYDSLKKLKKENSTTAYAVLLALVSYIVSDYSGIVCKSKYAKPLLPVSIRGKNRPKDLSNKIGGATIRLPLGETNSGKLIEQIAIELNTKLTEDAYYAYYLWAFILSKLPTSLRKYLLYFSAKKTSFICTNLIGPNHPIVIADAEIEEQYVIPALMPGHGLGFGFMKSNQKMQIAIIFDPHIIKDRLKLKNSLMTALGKMGISEGYKIRES